MPSVKVLEEKKAKVAALKERIGAAVAGVIVDYKGTTVEDDTKLRKELREAGVEYTVAKNTLIRIAVEGTSPCRSSRPVRMARDIRPHCEQSAILQPFAHVSRPATLTSKARRCRHDIR